MLLRSGALLVLFASVAFSAKAIIIKLAYRHGVDALTLLTLRMLMAGPMFLALGWWANRYRETTALHRGDWWKIAGLGFLGYYLSSLFDFLGLQYITAALERLILYLYPTFTVLMSAAFMGYRIRRRDLFALFASYCGIGLVFWHDLHADQKNVLLGSALVACSAVTYSIYVIGNGEVGKRVGAIRFACAASVVSTAFVIAHYIAVSDVSKLVAQPAAVYQLTLLMAVVSTVLPVVAMSVGIRRIGASNAAMLGVFGPVATIALGYLFLDEPITLRQLAGAALVIAGVLAITLKRPASVSAPPERT